ncbi:MAG: hypothetical protein IJ367_00630, partial [Clostridia bacterium]|nr:hypothetical protein [Clostridia bacterium]
MNAISQRIHHKKTKSHTKKPWKVKEKLGWICSRLLVCLLGFFLSRASVFTEVIPLPVSAFLALGGGIFPFLGAAWGSYTMGAMDNLCSLVCALVLKSLFREEKWDIGNLLVSHTAVWSVFLWMGNPTPYDVILKIVTLLIASLGYYVLKKSYRAQFVKSSQL